MPAEIYGPSASSKPGLLATIGNFVLNNIDNVGGVLKTIRDNAKARKALEIANAGGYHTLTAYQKSLIQYQGIEGKEFSIDPETGAIRITPAFVLIIIVIGTIVFLILRRR
jgi:hypothetical protein